MKFRTIVYIIFSFCLFLLVRNSFAQLTTNMPEYKGGYLFAHMTKADYGRLYYAISKDGLHWINLNKGKRIMSDYKGHPDICEGKDGRFYLMGNTEKGPDIRIWVSNDLIKWEVFSTFLPDMSDVHQYTNVSTPYHGAPKIFYDAANMRYIITWHATTFPEKEESIMWQYWDNMRTLYITSKDLKTFSKAKRLIPFDSGQIDLILRKDGDKYYAIFKDERYPDFNWTTGKSIRICSASAIEGPWSEPGPVISPSFCEAPAAIPRPDGMGWFVYSERYSAYNYELATASSLSGPWYGIHRALYSVPEGSKHGGMIMINSKIYEGLINAFGK